MRTALCVHVFCLCEAVRSTELQKLLAGLFDYLTTQHRDTGWQNLWELCLLFTRFLICTVVSCHWNPTLRGSSDMSGETLLIWLSTWSLRTEKVKGATGSTSYSRTVLPEECHVFSPEIGQLLEEWDGGCGRDENNRHTLSHTYTLQKTGLPNNPAPLRERKWSGSKSCFSSKQKRNTCGLCCYPEKTVTTKLKQQYTLNINSTPPHIY